MSLRPKIEKFIAEGKNKIRQLIATAFSKPKYFLTAFANNIKDEAPTAQLVIISTYISSPKILRAGKLIIV